MAENKLRSWLRERRRREEQWRRVVDAQHLDGVRQRGQLSDEELIARAPGFPGPGYQMEMERRLKDAITDLTTQTVAARRSADRAASRLVWLTVVLVVLTGALVALTVVLAMRGDLVFACGRSTVIRLTSRLRYCRRTGSS